MPRCFRAPVAAAALAVLAVTNASAQEDLEPLRLWKITLPWICLAWRESDALSGFRLYLSFPF